MGAIIRRRDIIHHRCDRFVMVSLLRPEKPYDNFDFQRPQKPIKYTTKAKIIRVE
jgi:hypothetical protein